MAFAFCAALACCANVQVHPVVDGRDVAPDADNQGFEHFAPLAYAVHHCVKLARGGQRDVVICVIAPQVK